MSWCLYRVWAAWPRAYNLEHYRPSVVRFFIVFCIVQRLGDSQSPELPQLRDTEKVWGFAGAVDVAGVNVSHVLGFGSLNSGIITGEADPNQGSL